MPLHRAERGPFRAVVAIAAILPALAACHTKEQITGSIYPSDFRDRHPIVLQDGPRVLDVFVEGPGGLVTRGRQDLADFFGEYRRYGSGPMLVQVPVGAGANPNTRRAVATIRTASGGRVAEQTYRPTDPTAASPIRLTFKRLQARVADKCGLWPDDLGVSDARQNMKNEQYWNFGCATQANFASQVADPVDLVRGRHETPPDTGRRMFNFGQIRQGQDPSTQWRQENTTVSQGVSQ